MPSTDVMCEEESQLPTKRLRSSYPGLLHDKLKCVWCIQKGDTKHPQRKGGHLYRLNTLSAWRSFKRHVTFIEDHEMKTRLTQLVLSTFRQ